jgi:hypothetical protein
MIARSRLTHIVSTVLFALTAFGCTAAALADDSSPATRAARLTFVEGTVTVNEAGNSGSVPGQPNLPLLNGVQVVTGGDGQAEIEFEDGSVVRLTPNSAVSLDNLTIGPDGVFVTDLSLLHGLAYCELRATPQYSFRLNAGGDILSPVENTTVRISFDQPPATFSVLDGTAQIDRRPQAGTGYQAQVHTGETLRTDPDDGSRYFLTQEIAADSWDQWNDDLDQQASTQSADSTAVRDTYAGADGYGWSDLDTNGNWYNVPGEGPVWQPQVAEDDASFDPYGNGAWVYYPATGYVWASGYSWGWTPYRCGNWSYYNGFGWGWVPGAGCGGRGWGFGGGDSAVNIGRFPRGYRPIRIPRPNPRPHPGPLPPILPVHPWNASHPPAQQAAAPSHQGPRSINGIAASRIQPIHHDPGQSGAPVGSSLHRDFPVDSATHRPVLGQPSANPMPAHTSATQRAGYPTPAQTSAPEHHGDSQPASPHPSHMGYGGPAYSSDNPERSTPPSRPEPNSLPGQRPASPNTPPQRSEPTPHPTYSPQPPHPAEASHPIYSPPPPRQAEPSRQPEPSHQNYSPPPPSAPRDSPPPPPQPHSPK